MRLRYLRISSRRLLAAGVLAAVVTGCTPQSPFVLEPTEDRVDFRRVYVGTTRFELASWENTSAADVTIDSIQVDPNDGPFSLSLRQPFTPAVLAPGRTEFVSFFFSPTAAGPASAKATPVTTAGTAGSVTLAGEGVVQISDGGLELGDRDLVPGQVLDFGDVPFPGGENLAEFRLFNRTGDPIGVRSYFTDGKQGFKLVAPTPPFIVPANDSVAVAIVFRPADTGEFSDAITFYDWTRTRQAGTALKGRGVPREEGGGDGGGESGGGQ